MRIHKQMALLVLGLVATGIVAAGGGREQDATRGPGRDGYGPRHGREQAMERLESRLDLSDEQIAAFQQLQVEREAFFEDRGGARDEYQEQLRELWLNDSVEAEQIEALLSVWDAESAERRAFAAAQLAAMHEILTPEQRAELAEIADGRGFGAFMMFGSHGGHRGGHGRGGRR